MTLSLRISHVISIALRKTSFDFHYQPIVINCTRWFSELKGKDNAMINGFRTIEKPAHGCFFAWQQHRSDWTILEKWENVSINLPTTFT